MHYKTNRQNHDFQIAFFLVGSCQTADAAYGLLHDLRQDREAALASARASEKRILAKVKLDALDHASFEILDGFHARVVPRVRLRCW